MNDPRIIEATRDAIKVIVRRPHAYAFRKRYEEAKIPGLTVLDERGQLVGSVALPATDAVDRVVGLLGGRKQRGSR